MVGPAVCREACAHLRTVFGMSERRACRIIGADRASIRYHSRRPSDDALRQRLRQLAHERRRFGYRRLHVLLRREGHVVNRKRVYRLYKAKRLMVRCRGGRKRSGRRWRCPRPRTSAGSLDFVHDQMVDGRRFRILAVVDDCTRECLALVADTSIPVLRVALELDHLQCRAPLGRRASRRLALHRSRQDEPERLHRELQRSSETSC
jgi:putative transposase